MSYTFSLIQIEMINEKKISPSCLKQVTELLQEIKDDLWHWQVLKVNRVGNFINLLFFGFKLPNSRNLIPKFYISLKSHHSSNFFYALFNFTL